jgi:putative ABC transport system ATP-binding protein
VTDPIIQVRSLHKSFIQGAVKVEVLKGLDLEVEEGSILAIRGRSGSGKTTLLNILGGLDTHFTGTVNVVSHALSAFSDPMLSRFRNESIGFVFQSFNLIDSMTCAENVMLPSLYATRRGVTVSRDRLLHVLGRVELAGQADGPTRTMSGGQKQRAAIGRAILLKPRILLCDEPTGNLDDETGASILDLFRDLNSTEGMTVVLVTHEKRVAAIANRVLSLEGGVLV